MRIRLILPLLLSTAACLSANNLIVNGSFENPALTGPYPYKVLFSGDTFYNPSWDVTGSLCGTNCVLVLDGNYADELPVTFHAADGTYALDLTGGGSRHSSDGGVAQTVNLASGNYRLSFYVGNQWNELSSYAGNSAVQLFINNVSNGIFTNSDNTPYAVNWKEFTYQFTASGSTTIQFRNATGWSDLSLCSDDYAGLDNVSLEAVPPAAVPEPGTFVLLGIAGAAGLGFRLRRRA